MIVGEPFISDTREVSLSLDGDYISVTSAGKMDMGCHGLKLKYRSDTGQLLSVEVRGVLIRESDIATRASRLRSHPGQRSRWPMTRRYSVDFHTGAVTTPTPPPWLEELIERFRPGKDSG